MTPAYDWIAHHAGYQPDRLACVDLATGRRFTYRAFDRRVGRLANALSALGAGRGERVAALAHNAVELFELQFACARLGAVFLPLNWRLALPELQFICADARPAVLFHGPAFAEPAAGLDLPRKVALGAPYEGLLERASETCPSAPLGLDDDWMLIYTSGTTGRPKGARITHRMELFNAVNCAMCARVGPDSVGLTFLPQFHIGGLNLYATPTFHFGGATYVMRTFDPGESLRLLADPALGITHAFGVPTNFLFMSQLEEFAAADLRRLNLGVGGASAPLPLLEAYAAKGVLLSQAWGMTETATLGAFLSPDKALAKLGSSGRKVMHAALRIVDAQGRDLPAGEVGELLIKGPTVTPGYWNRPEANAQAFSDGWFRTGDAARVDDEGFYTIVDRWKDMYISGGENVYPAEVESVIFALDAVAEAAVIGVPDPKWGEVGRAFVALKPGARLSEEEVIAHCAKNLARFKLPRRVVFLPELPHNATGKVTKHALPRD